MNINANELIDKSRNLSHNEVPSKNFLYTVMFSHLVTTTNSGCGHTAA